MNGQPPEWVAQYVGIPFVPHGRSREAIDCWGLVALVLREQKGIVLPDYQYRTPASVDDLPSVERTFYDGVATDLWTQVEQEQEGDVILLRIGGYVRHCGVVVAPETSVMLHCIEGIGSCIDGYRRPRFRNAVEGFYRYSGSP